jgi:hypothetical protein
VECYSGIRIRVLATRFPKRFLALLQMGDDAIFVIPSEVEESLDIVWRL